MMSSFYPYPVWQFQADATLSQASPGTGTKYTVLDTTKNVRIISISVSVTWTVQPTPLEIHFTVDGQTWTATQANPVTATNYFLLRAPGSTTSPTLGAASAQMDYQAFAIEGRRVKVEAETTGGTTSNLTARVKYAKR